MPLYEYQCESCAKRFERIQKFSDPPIETCPSCNGRVKKLLSSPAFQFKGTGWYVTDYARKSTDGGGKKATDASADSSKSDSTTPDSSSSSSSSDSTSKADAPAKKD